MTRKVFLAAVSAGLVAAAGIWAFRAGRSSPGAEPDTESLVRRAWVDSKLVALEGDQEIQVEDGRVLRAHVLTSRQGDLRIEYRSAPLAGITVWETPTRTYRYSPRSQRLTVTERLASPTEDAGRELQLIRNYAVHRSGEEEVAGRTAIRVDLRPRSGKGTWKQIWIDRETAVILRSDAQTARGRIVRSTRFTQVRYLPAGSEPDAAAFMPGPALMKQLVRDSGSAIERLDLPELNRRAGFAVRLPAQLPRGYTLSGAYETSCPCRTPHSAARLEFTDGLNTLSLFQCGSPRCTSAENCFAAGGEAPQAVRAERDGIYFLAVGDLPRAELDQLIRSAK